MKKSHILTVLFIALSLTAFAQEYKITEVVHLPNDMTAKKIILTERIDGGKKCAVLRISTKNIRERDRDAFTFECDLGSKIRERRKDGGEICLWVSPGIKTLILKNAAYGNYVLHIPEMLQGNVESLNTYMIKLVGLKDLPKEDPLPKGSSQVVFRPSPKDAVLFLNNDSIGIGNQVVRTFSGKYKWTLKHELYHTKTGTVTFVNGQTDTLEIALDPSYGYLRIDCDSVIANRNLGVVVDRQLLGGLPFQSKQLSNGTHRIALTRGNDTVANSKVIIKDSETCIINAQNLINGSNQFNYKPLIGKLILTSPLDSVSAVIDDQPFGLLPLSIDSMAVGAHTIILSKTGYSSLTKEFLIEENKALNLNLSLNKACLLTVTSDARGDKVFEGTTYLGETPITLNMAFGNHVFIIKRNVIQQLEKEIYIAPDETEKTITFSFGQYVIVESDCRNGKIVVDDVYKGKSPVRVYMPIGSHSITATKGWRTGFSELTIEADQPINNTLVTTKIESPSSFLSHGITFVIGNMAFVTKSPVYGLSIGALGKNSDGGWYFSLMANKNYKLFNSNVHGDENGYIGGILPLYTGEKLTFRASATAGGVMRIAGPVFIRVGAGYGTRLSSWKTQNETWVTLDPYSWKNFEASAGVQCILYNFVLSAEALAPLDLITEKKKLVEFRFGVGFCLRHKHEN